MLRTFVLHLVGWATGLALVHSGLRVFTGTAAPGSFVSDLTSFSAAMLALAAMPAGVEASRDLVLSAPGTLRRLAAILGASAVFAVGAYGIVDQVAPRAFAGVSEAAAQEPAASTSAQLRAASRSAVAEARAIEVSGASSITAWQRVNRLAFEHELRIVQVLLIPIMGLIGILAGVRARRLGRPWQTAVLWGLGLFLVFSMFMSGENGYELLVMRSAGPMAFVAWLQAVVPGCVLVGLGFAALPDVFRPMAEPHTGGA